jgi:hypothetical protein
MHSYKCGTFIDGVDAKRLRELRRTCTLTLYNIGARYVICRPYLNMQNSLRVKRKRDHLKGLKKGKEPRPSVLRGTTA